MIMIRVDVVAGFCRVLRRVMIMIDTRWCGININREVS